MQTSPQDSTDSVRKRVCKACDRCRLKKSKCDGTSPCGRCRADNAICVFGERKKSHDKVYPKGYVEMLEQQQGQLVGALQEMYRRLSAAQAWTGPVLDEASGHPLTHDILAALNLLAPKHDGSGDLEAFEEDFDKLQSNLLADGAEYVRRRGSISSDSERSHPGSHSRPSPVDTPVDPKPPVSRDHFPFNSATSSPLPRSPVVPSRHSYPPATTSSISQPSPLAGDPQFYQAEWTLPNLGDPEALLRSRFALQPPELHQSLADIETMMTSEPFDASSDDYDASFDPMPILSYPATFPNPLAGSLPDFAAGLDAMDVDFNRFISVQT